ncbi:MAG: ABC transporter permease [Acidobacteriota bacterium]
MKNAASPPRLALRLLEFFSGWQDDYGAAGDFEEFYRALADEQGVRRARRACWRQVLAAFPGYAKNVILWSDAMLKNYLKIAVRNLRKHKGYSFINISGLAVGMACALFILLWVQDELSFDRFHANAETLYRLEQESDTGQGKFRHSSMPYALGPILKAEIPEIQQATRIAEQPSLLVRCGEKTFFEENVAAVDPQIFQMFTFPLVQGDPATALSRPGSLIVTEDMAKKYFGQADALGQTMTFNEVYAFTVTGVLKGIPPNSTLSFDMLVPFDFVRTLGQYSDSMTSNDIHTYVRLQARSDPAEVGAKITRLIRDRIFAESRTNPEIVKNLAGNPEIARRFEAFQKSRTFILMPLVDINLFGGRMAIRNVYLYSALALFVLLIAGINFMNLATARSAGRAKEIGLRKVVGARRKSLVGQFYGESIMTAVLAGAAALILVILLFPAFRALSGKSMTLHALGSGRFLFGTLAVILFTGIVAGSYPALYLSSFQPIRVLQGHLGGGAKRAFFRKTLVVFQFGLSILFLIGMGAVSRQVDYMRSKKLGYDKEQMIYLPMRDKAASSYAVFKERLLQNPRILGVTATRHPPTAIEANDTYADWEGKNPDLRFKISFASVDFDFPETMKIEMIAGRSFSRNFPSDVRRAFMVNEGVPKLMGLPAAAAVGKRFVFRGYEGTIVGVMKDFHYQSVRNALEPLAVVVDPKDFRYAVVRLTAGQIPASLDDIKETWRRVLSHYPIEYRFFDEDFDQMYRKDERMGTILKVFSVMAVVISCLGLFGLASYTAERRTKEIGIRKVLGASSRRIMLLLSKEFAVCVLAANAAAWPVAYLLMRNWLRSYAYNPGIAWWLFVAAGTGALAIALLTVSFQAFRAAAANPARSMRHE